MYSYIPEGLSIGERGHEAAWQEMSLKTARLEVINNRIAYVTDEKKRLEEERLKLIGEVKQQWEILFEIEEKIKERHATLALSV